MALEGLTAGEHEEVDVVDALLRRRRHSESVDLDITPMIDIVFLLLIFFLVASIPDMQTEADLPPARHGVGVNPHSSIVFTLAERSGPAGAKVYLSDGKSGAPIPADPGGQEAAIDRALRGQGGVALPDDFTEQEAIIREAVSTGFHRMGLTNVLLKAEKGVLHRDVDRVSRAIASADAEGIQLNLAVFEVR